MPLIDLHCHTKPLSHDSFLTADDLIDATKGERLDGVCLTEHDFFWEPEEVRDLARRHDFLVIPGVEVNTEDGHFVVFGLQRYVYGMHRTAELSGLVQDASGVMIAAHPYRRQLPFELRESGDWTEVLERAAANPAYGHVAAMESHNGRGSERENAFAAELAQRLALPGVAASDCHERADVGRCATEVQATVRDVDELIAALQSGRFQPVVFERRGGLR